MIDSSLVRENMMKKSYLIFILIISFLFIGCTTINREQAEDELNIDWENIEEGWDFVEERKLLRVGTASVWKSNNTGSDVTHVGKDGKAGITFFVLDAEDFGYMNKIVLMDYSSLKKGKVTKVAYMADYGYDSLITVFNPVSEEDGTALYFNEKDSNFIVSDMKNASHRWFMIDFEDGELLIFVLPCAHFEAAYKTYFGG